MKTLTLLKHSIACLAILILPAIADAGPGKSPKNPPGWIGAFLSGADDGVKVSGVVRDGPADIAGLRAGDLVTDANGKSVRSPGELSCLVRDTAISKEIALRVRRSGEEKTMTVKVAEWPDWFSSPGTPWPSSGWMRHGEWRWEWPPKSWMESGAAQRLQMEMDKLRKQLDELRNKLEKHLSDKTKEPSHI
ncbi:MAG: PDZ domain-containing protein [Verrucomicrobia bacterium]|nr:PDZ domain-containing protein [Verrucomicrobiota bacterium]